ncbi:hypothetical protein PGTUg99_018099 [Puccinia graminis f. sp. tritici]|uniref:Uncharacterized protein n=1 Tax=Puccinia graminis f. sp. tritici TaxID=56615 RepID=A0A5B0RLU4_PUCGR|nr:hypothetical protein PGTUg99_018099 [Puccinia graminis f. sp. tritici]
MLDVNLYTLNFVRSTNEPDKLFLIQEATGEPVYFRLRAPEGSGETRTELYHAATLAPLGVFQHLSSKLKLISLTNPSSTIELKNSGYINFEWTFYFDKILKFCWRKDIVGMAGNKRGYTCWMSRKPDPDYPCAIYRPGSSTVPPSCQFLDFNIRRIENLHDPRGLEFAIILALLGFTEAVADHDRSPPTSPLDSQRQITAIEANELRVTENSSTSELVAQGHKLFEDPLFLYLSVHAPSPKTFKRATAVAEQIKRDRLKRHGEELYQYLVDDIMSHEISTGKPSSSGSSCTNSSKSSSLKVYLSRTPLDELLPKSATSSKSNQKSGRSSLRVQKPQLPPKEPRAPFLSSSLTSSSSSSTSSHHASALPHNSLHSRFMTGVHRPFSKIVSIASSSSQSSAYDLQYITPYYLEEDEPEEEEELTQQTIPEDPARRSNGQEQDYQTANVGRSGASLANTEEPGSIEEPDDRLTDQVLIQIAARSLLCLDSLNAIDGETDRATNLVKENGRGSSSSRESRPSTRASETSFRMSSSTSTSSPEDSRRSSVPSSSLYDDPDSLVNMSEHSNTSLDSRIRSPDSSPLHHRRRADSVRRRGSSGSSSRSSASSFVELFLSSSGEAHDDDPVNLHRNLPSAVLHTRNHPSLKRLARKTWTSPAVQSAWKRLGSHSTLLHPPSVKLPSSSSSSSSSNTTTTWTAGTTNSSNFFSSLFSRKLHLS